VPVSVLEGWSLDGVEMGDVLAELVSWSLARWTVDKDAFTIHRLVQEVTRLGMSEGEKTASLEKAFARIRANLPDPNWNEACWRLWERLAPNVDVLLRHPQGDPIEVGATWIMNRYGLWLHHRAQYAEAEPLLEWALRIREGALGPDHPDVAISLSDLARLYQERGRYAEAAPLFARSLRIREKALGSDHPYVASSLNNLARLYRCQAQYAHAEPLFRRALEIREWALGLDHPDVGKSLNGLAGLYRIQNQYANAESLYQRVLAIREKALGPCTPMWQDPERLCVTIAQNGPFAGSRNAGGSRPGNSGQDRLIRNPGGDFGRSTSSPVWRRCHAARN
jgi:tetratricopeptide (TPR) repeat protein